MITPPEITGIGDEAAADLAGQIAVATRLRWSSLELRTIDGAALADLGPAAARQAVDAVTESGLGVVCLASRIANWARPISTPFDTDLAELDALAAWAHALRCRYVRIMSYPNAGWPDDDWRRAVLDRIRRLARRAEELDLVLLHENCSGWAGASGPRMLELVESVDSPALRLLFDTGNGIAYDYDAHVLLRQVLPHVAHVHIKDAVPTPDGPRYTLPGDGASRVVDCLRLLLDSGYNGALSLEPHLATLPHEGIRTAGGAVATFVEAARRLGTLLETEVLPTLSRRS